MGRRTVLICDLHNDEDESVRTRLFSLDGKHREAELCDKAVNDEPLIRLMDVGRATRASARRAVRSTLRREVEATPGIPAIPAAPVPGHDQAAKANGSAPAAAFKAPTNGATDTSSLAYSPEVRKWAKETGLKVGDNGRMKADVIAQYVAAHS